MLSLCWIIMRWPTGLHKISSYDPIQPTGGFSCFPEMTRHSVLVWNGRHTQHCPPHDRYTCCHPAKYGWTCFQCNPQHVTLSRIEMCRTHWSVSIRLLGRSYHGLHMSAPINFANTGSPLGYDPNICWAFTLLEVYLAMFVAASNRKIGAKFLIEMDPLKPIFPQTPPTAHTSGQGLVFMCTFLLGAGVQATVLVRATAMGLHIP